MVYAHLVPLWSNRQLPQVMFGRAKNNDLNNQPPTSKCFKKIRPWRTNKTDSIGSVASRYIDVSADGSSFQHDVILQILRDLTDQPKLTLESMPNKMAPLK